VHDHRMVIEPNRSITCSEAGIARKPRLSTSVHIGYFMSCNRVLGIRQVAQTFLSAHSLFLGFADAQAGMPVPPWHYLLHGREYCDSS